MGCPVCRASYNFDYAPFILWSEKSENQYPTFCQGILGQNLYVHSVNGKLECQFSQAFGSNWKIGANRSGLQFWIYSESLLLTDQSRSSLWERTLFWSTPFLGDFWHIFFVFSWFLALFLWCLAHFWPILAGVWSDSLQIFPLRSTLKSLQANLRSVLQMLCNFLCAK